MLKETIDILTSYPISQKRCIMGNIAIARGAIEAGVNGVFSYPGTPSTEISEVFNYVDSFLSNPDYRQIYPVQANTKIYFEYSINEKIALEKAIAYSIGNRSSMCVMKNVGMNVASDALMSITYQTISAPLVIVVCDDPGCHSSSNEQDSRYWGAMANVPLLNPSNPNEAKEFTVLAFRLSGKLKLPVIIRTTTRVSHSRGIVNFGVINADDRIAGFERIPEHINIPARTAAAHSRLLEKLNDPEISAMQRESCKIISGNENTRYGIITSGVASEYVCEVLHDNKINEQVYVLNIGLVNPFPEKVVADFLKNNLQKILIVEELEPITENAIRVIAQKECINTEILGKGFSGLTVAGEFNIDLIKQTLFEFLDLQIGKVQKQPLENVKEFTELLPPRPPVLCAGCPHRSTFYLLKLVIPREESELILCGDIGCFGLGALPPLKMIDTINHMGMSISMAQGLSEALTRYENSKIIDVDQDNNQHCNSPKPLKTVALVGDGTFFHSGLASLVNAVYTRANILVVIFDNRTIAMTGRQSHPGASQNLPKYNQIEIAPLLRGLGIEVVEEFDPFNLRDGFAKLNKAMQHRGISVVIAKAPCVFLPEFIDLHPVKKKIIVEESLCNTCANHDDEAIVCSRCYSSRSNLSRARAKLFAEVSIPGELQLCPANICNHGFFNSILEGDYKSAVEIVRDKMLFSKTCGDICHRSCELMKIETDEKWNEEISYISTGNVPIKALKKFVSSFDNNYLDFSAPISRAKNAEKKNKKIAVIGAGPSGLSAAYDLVQNGYEVEIFEKQNKPGGMVAFGIPWFRMDKSGFEYEAMQLEKMGVQFHFNSVLGTDYSLTELSESFDAIILTIGMWHSKKLDLIEMSVPESKRSDALTFLKKFNSGISEITAEITFVVIGGGNSALDTARAARILNPKNRVIITCIEKENDMPAFAEEISNAKAEGIEIIPDSYVSNCSCEDRINIVLNSFSNKEFLCELKCDFILTAIGQSSDSDALIEINRNKFDSSGRIFSHENNPIAKNIFIAGDIHSGNSMSVIGAIASGKKAAVDVRKLLENYGFNYEGEKALKELNNLKGKLLDYTPVLNSGNIEGLELKTIRDEVERFNLYQSCMKCNHCIDNFGCPAMIKVNGKVRIDDDRCTLCGLCIDVCPNDAIHWVSDPVLVNQSVPL